MSYKYKLFKKPIHFSLLCYITLLPILVNLKEDNNEISLFQYFSYLTLNLTLTLKLKPYLNVSLKNADIYYKNKYHLFVELKYFKSVQRIKYYIPLHLLLTAILDAILDFSAHTNNGHCTLADFKRKGLTNILVYNI